MAEYLPIRALNRSAKLRINKQKVHTYLTTYADLENPVVKKELNSHSSIGQYVVVGPITSTLPTIVTSGLAVKATSPASKVVTSAEGHLRTESTGAVVTIAEKSFTIGAAAANPRIDIVEVKNDGSEVKVKAGTEGTTPTAPTVDAEFTVIAEIAVAKEFATITQANITPKRTLQ